MRHRTTAATTTPTAISMAMSKSHQLASCDHSRSSTDVNGAMQGRSVVDADAAKPPRAGVSAPDR
jgi:hypothetical protein